jgi:hypothetical protein
LLHPQVLVADAVAEHWLEPQPPLQLPLQLPQPKLLLQVHDPPFKAPQLAEPQLESAVHLLLQLEQVKFVCLF